MPALGAARRAARAPLRYSPGYPARVRFAHALLPTLVPALGACSATHSTSITWRPPYQPQLLQTMCGCFTAPQFGHSEREGAERRQFDARRWRVFPYVAGANGLRQPVHADDLAAACVALARTRPLRLLVIKCRPRSQLIVRRAFCHQVIAPCEQNFWPATFLFLIVSRCRNSTFKESCTAAISS